MGNKSSKNNKNFFSELKSTKSYRDFIIKMNQMISRRNIQWEYDSELIKPLEIVENQDLIENFYFFVSDYIYE